MFRGEAVPPGEPGKSASPDVDPANVMNFFWISVRFVASFADSIKLPPIPPSKALHWKARCQLQQLRVSSSLAKDNRVFLLSLNIPSLYPEPSLLPSLSSIFCSIAADPCPLSKRPLNELDLPFHRGYSMSAFNTSSN